MSNPYIVWLRDPTTIPSVSATVNATGVSATGAVGTVTVSGDANRDQTGVSATGAVGTVTVSGDANRTQTGVSATGAVGSVSVSGDANRTQTGVSCTGSTGTVTTSGDANRTQTGVSCASATGTPTISGDANVSVTGVEAVSSTGTVTVTADSGSVDATVAVTGVSAIGSVGTVQVDVTSHARKRNVRFAPIRDAQAFAHGVGAESYTSFVTVQTQVRGKPRVTTEVRADGASARGASGRVSISTDVSITPLGAQGLSFAKRLRPSGGGNLSVEGFSLISAVAIKEVSAAATADVYGEWSRGEAGEAHVKTVQNPTDEELIALIVAARRRRKK